MNQYSYGTSAYRLDYYEQNQAREISRKRAIARRRFEFRLKAIVTVILAVAVCFTVLYRNVLIIEASTEVSSLQTQLEKTKEENNQKMVALEKSVDLKKVEEIATEKLGMKHPESYQTVYINVTQDNYAEVVQNEKTAENKASFGMLTQKIRSFLEYLH